MRKWLGFILTAVLLVSVLCVAAMADDGLVLTFSSAAGKAGDEVEIVLQASGNPGIGGIICGVTYDKSVLELQSAEGRISGGTWDIDDIAANDIISWADYTGRIIYADDGDILALRFKIKDGAAASTTDVSLSFGDMDAISDRDGNMLEGFTVKPGTITITSDEEHTHAWNRGVITTPATCTADGVRTYICGVCGERKTEAVPATGHSWGDWTVTTPATEDAEGVETRVCRNNSEHTETRAIPKLDHVHTLVKTDAAAAACETAGHIEYWTCSGCGRLFRDEGGTAEIDRAETVVPALGHDWDGGVITTAPTCTADGVRTYTCAVCGETKTEAVPATGHSWGDWTVTTPAAEDAEGVETRVCRNNSEHTETRAIPKLDHVHTLVKTDAVAATRAEAGHIAYWTCAKCARLFRDAEAKNEITLEDTILDRLMADLAGGAWKRSGSGWWYENADGSYPAGEWATDGDKIYYFQDDGYMAAGWRQIDGDWYYFASSGAMRTGWLKSGGRWYYMDPDTGVMRTGWAEIGGARYYLNASGAMQTGWAKIDGAWYCFNASGAMRTGWLRSGGRWYYLDESTGAMAAGTTLVIDGVEYAFRDSGAWVR